MKITKSGTQTSNVAPASTFTGQVRFENVFAAEAPARSKGNIVTFEPGARTHWHSHPLGQTLIITHGRGLVQVWGQEARSVTVGDVVWFPAGEKHWHGASGKTAMTHLAIGEFLDGRSADWLGEVTEAEYATADLQAQ